MSLDKTKKTLVFAIAAVLFGLSHVGAQGTSVFDLEWDGPETSTVDECVDGNYFCITLPVVGSIGVGLESNGPYLVNVDSDILLPPQTPNSRPVISPTLWHNFDLLVGEYLSADNDGDVSMVFRPAEIGGQLRAFEIFVDITDGGQSLVLTGGIEQVAASPLEPDVRFSVSGRLVTTDPGLADLLAQAGYNAWRNSFGTSVANGTGADGNGNGVIDAADYTIWRDRLPVASNLVASHAVPEPATTMLVLMGALIAHICSRRPKSKT